MSNKSNSATQPSPSAAEVELPPLPILPQTLLNRIADYGMARTDGLPDIDRIDLWESLIACIKRYAGAYGQECSRAATAAKTPREDACGS